MSDEAPSVIAVRPAGPADLSFIFSGWLRSYHESEVARHVPNDVYFSSGGHHGIVRRLLDEVGAVVACSASDPTELYGFACGAPGVLHYVYVKAAFRRLGVAKLLLGALGVIDAPTVVTHHNRVIKAWQDNGRRYAFNPYGL